MHLIKAALARMLILPISVFAACIIAALYGGAHDIVTFHISPEYFTKFKFIQFQVTKLLVPNVVKAICVGVKASWWMGIFIGFFVGMPLLFARWDQVVGLYRLGSGLVIGCAVLGAVSFGFFVTDYSGYFLPTDIADRDAFYRVGSIHNGSYFGGAIGTAIAVIVLSVMQRREKTRRF